jgi:hypothetical protein
VEVEELQGEAEELQGEAAELQGEAAEQQAEAGSASTRASTPGPTLVAPASSTPPSRRALSRRSPRAASSKGRR